MRSSLKRGVGIIEGIVILAVILMFVFVLPGEDKKPSQDIFRSDSASSNPSNTNNSSGSSIGTGSLSQYVYLGTGNAAYSYQPYDEYITIDNYGDTSIDITGWQLKNGKDKRPYDTGGSLQRFSADIAIIPQAAKYISPYGTNIFTNVVLGKGERAIITTGLPAIQAPYKIVSFKENICSGYLEASEDYAFTPPLNQSCPRPSNEPGLENLGVACRDFISTLSSCQTPEFDGKDYLGKDCRGCVNKKPVSSSCYVFIKERFNYQGCIVNHVSDPDFSGRTWRVFLNRGWEMWAESYESIELFNNLGQLIDSENY